MSKEEAADWIACKLNVPRETLAQLDHFASLVLEASGTQNLIARSTQHEIWSRHILDSAQLALYAPKCSNWLDLGSGAGFPGIVVAIIKGARATLIESRQLRANFLREVQAALFLTSVEVIGERIENVPDRLFDVISARAFAPLSKLLSVAHRFSTPDTIWILPKGRSAQAELDAIAGSWQGEFRIEPSVTNPESGIIVATRVQPRKQR